MRNKIREFFSNFKEKFFSINFFIVEFLFLFMIDFFNQYVVVKDFSILFSTRVLIFDFIWIMILLIILYLIKYKIRKYLTLILNIVLLIMSCANYFMFAYFHSVFSFKDLFLAGDGLSFVSSIFKYINIKLIIYIIISTLAIIFIHFKFSTNVSKKKFNIKSIKTPIIIIYIILLLFIRNNITNNLKSTNDGWNSTEVLQNESNYYSNWIEPAKLIRICGTYEYVVKDFYESFLKKDNVLEAKKYVEDYISNYDDEDITNNNYYKLFEGKNLIFVMIESMDDWMINEKSTPTISYMMKHGFNFINHYSPPYVTGDTANTEFIANTGLYPNINKLSPNYAYVDNSYPFSIANLFKNNGYTVNSFHRSNGFIYNRTYMHLSLGYETYNDYYAMGISDENVDLDENIIINGYNKIISSDKFMSFIITYSPHGPYSYDKIECKKNLDKIKTLYPTLDNEEEICSYSAARETDNMFKLLLKKLYNDNILDDTIIVAFSDHRNKDYSIDGEDDKVNKTSFFIYSNTMDENKISTITSSINILPTVINLFGIDNNYVYPGYDALNTNEEYVIFRDYTYFDGENIKTITDKQKQTIDYSTNLLVSNYYK